jgi:hypothetical protein
MPNRRRRRPPLSGPPPSDPSLSDPPSSDPPFDPPLSDPPLSDPPLSDPPLSDPPFSDPTLPESLPLARPLPQNVKDTGHRYIITQRIHCLSLLAEECFTTTYIEAKTGVKERSQRYIRKRATERGFDPKIDPRILEYYVVDNERSDKPKKITPEQEIKLLSIVRSDHLSKEKSSEVLAYETGISSNSALRILDKNGLKNVKPITKPGLTTKIKKVRYQWALDHKDWTLED